MNKRQYKKFRFGYRKSHFNVDLYIKRRYKYNYDAWRKRHWIWYNVYRKGEEQVIKFRPEKMKGV